MISIHYAQMTAALIARVHAPGLVSALVQCQLPRQRDARAVNEFAYIYILGDLNGLLGYEEEAEEDYRRAGKLAMQRGAESAHQWSYRAAGRKALLSQRYDVAAACFQKLMAAENCPRDLRLEACLLSALILHAAGGRAAARQLLGQCRDESGWQRLHDVIDADFNMRCRLHALPDLADDLYWEGGGDEGYTTGSALVRAAGGYEGDDPLVEQIAIQREAEIVAMGRLAYGEVRDMASIEPILRVSINRIFQWKVMCIEFAIGALASRNLQLAEGLVNMLGVVPPGSPNPISCQQLYCESKLKLLKGQVEEGFKLYRNYAKAVLQLMNSYTKLIRSFSSVMVQPELPRDEISACLPARYRRAYMYMLSNISRAELSISEVAGAINVSERALQLAFKEYLGTSPREILRRIRIKNIREALVGQEDATEDLMKVAHRFGVRNRSSLVSGFRRYFNEAPSAALRWG